MCLFTRCLHICISRSFFFNFKSKHLNISCVVFVGVQEYRDIYSCIIYAKGWDSNTLAPQCRAFRRALKIQKLKAQLFPGPEGARDTNDWCNKGYMCVCFFISYIFYHDCYSVGLNEQHLIQV